MWIEHGPSIFMEWYTYILEFSSLTSFFIEYFLEGYALLDVIPFFFVIKQDVKIF